MQKKPSKSSFLKIRSEENEHIQNLIWGFHGCDDIISFQNPSISHLNNTAMKLSTIFLYQTVFIFLKYSLVHSFVPFYDVEQSYEPIQYVDFDLISGKASNNIIEIDFHLLF